jgi:hypothetical protein
MEPARSIANLHASEVTKPTFCPRRLGILSTLNFKAADEKLDLSLDLTYGIGHYVQAQMVQWFADIGIAVGDWKCVACGKLHRFCKRPILCNICSAKRFDQVEVRFVSQVSGVSGGFDMLADMGFSKLRLVEIKTMAPDEFKALKAPLAEHRVRTNLYLRLVEESNHPHKDKIDTSASNVLYASKGGYGCADDGTLKKFGIWDSFSPLKEFVIQKDAVLTAPLSEQAKALTDYRLGKAGMPGRVAACTDIMSKRAQACEAKVACFGTKHPEGSMNPNPVEVSA